MFYNARWYDSQLGRFAQADSIVSGGVQGYDRYAYVNNNPVRYTDLTGHSTWDGSNERGVKPESLPPAEDGKKIQRKLNADEKKLLKDVRRKE